LNELPFVFANPWGALALLGVPIVIAIHCLQRKSRALQISTLFLLERLAPDSREGRRFTWLRNSLPFWLQILCVLILTWILAEPRWLEANAVQRVILVLDSSLSMRAFSDDLVERTSPRLGQLASLAPRTYWTVLETDPARPMLYEGLDLHALEQKLATWKPSLPAHDPDHALELALSLATRDALVIFLTDRPHDVPPGVDLLAIGEPIENCGLVGSRVTSEGDDLSWQIVAQNYGKETARRSWWIELAGQKTEEQSIDLEPGHAQILHGKFPPGLDRLEVRLNPDRFTLDDRIPLVRPQPKRLTVDLRGDNATTDLFIRLTQTLPALAAASPGQPADLAFIATDPHSLLPVSVHSSVVVFNDPLAEGALQGEPFVADDDPLNQDLNWQGLVAQPGPPLQLDPGDHVLLWKDRHPLIYIRPLGGDRRQLVFNFNFPTSNVTRLPAFVLLVSRFLETIRADKIVPETRNVELGEALTLTAHESGAPVILHNPDGSEVSFPARATVNLSAPSLPGFFTVTQGGETLLTGAAQFADARESDFSTAASFDTLAAKRAKLVNLHARAEELTSFWLLLIGLLLILNWWVGRPRVT
jgi:hypothetical protein